MTLTTKLGNTLDWRSEARANGIPRRPEPDRNHVDRDRYTYVTADKPPVVVVQPPAAAATKAPPALPAGRTRVVTRTFYTPEFQAQIVADFHATRAREPHLRQYEYCERIGLSKTTLSHWLAKAAEATAAAVRAHGQPPQAPRRDRPGRAFEVVSRELAEAADAVSSAKARLAALKAELRDLLDGE